MRLVDGALQGARRGAALTQRLLAFARQQDLQVKPVDLAELVSGMVCSAQTVSEPSALGRTNVSRLRDGVRPPVLSSSIRTIPSAPASHRIC